MTLDFTLQKYRDLLKSLKDYKIQTVAEYLKTPYQGPLVILRHDVDRIPKNALKIAQIEKEHNIASTYYFRYNGEVFNKNIIQDISKLGHEIGYHYETLSKTKGDFEEAIKIFQSELNEFRKIAEIKTISMHGSPLSKHVNDEIWKKHSFNEFNLLGDGSLSISNVSYYTDAGRCWDNQNNIRDYLKLDSKAGKTIRSTDELIDLANSHSNSKLYFNIHPERWTGNIFEWCISYSKDAVFNIGKRIIRST